MRDNDSTNPDIIVARGRARDNQTTLNIELELTSRTTGNVDPNVGSPLAGAVGGSVIGDIAQGIRAPNPRDPQPIRGS